MVNAEYRTENKMDGTHTAVDVEACVFRSTSSNGSGIVLRGSVSRSNDGSSPMALRTVDIKQAGKIDMVDAKLYLWHKAWEYM